MSICRRFYLKAVGMGLGAGISFGQNIAQAINSNADNPAADPTEKAILDML